MKTPSCGFTLIELMVTLAIVAVLLTIAAPSFRAFLLDSRVSAEADEFLSMVNFARSEAIKRNARVSMCNSSSGLACATSGNWEQGWIVFVDAGGTVGTFDSATDTILRVHGALTPQSTLVGTADVATYVSFIPDGRSQLDGGAAQAGTVDLCVSGAADGRRLSLLLGRAEVTTISTC
jgi:type IV fimbrial biogenesis protein FimT